MQVVFKNYWKGGRIYCPIMVEYMVLKSSKIFKRMFYFTLLNFGFIIIGKPHTYDSNSIKRRK